MVVLKETIQRKLNKENKRCSICKEYFNSDDIYQNNFEYLKNKRGEKYFHTSCIKEILKCQK